MEGFTESAVFELGPGKRGAELGCEVSTRLRAFSRAGELAVGGPRTHLEAPDAGAQRGGKRGPFWPGGLALPRPPGPPGSLESPGVRRAALRRCTPALRTAAARASGPENAGPGKAWSAAGTRSGGERLSRGDPPPAPQPWPPSPRAELRPPSYLLAIALPGSTIGSTAREEVSKAGAATRLGAGQSRAQEGAGP